MQADILQPNLNPNSINNALTAILTEKIRRENLHRKLDNPNPQIYDILSSSSALYLALENARNSRKLIEEKQQEIEELKAEAQDEQELAARDYQIWLVREQLTRAADHAENRLNYLSRIKTPSEIEEEKRKCQFNKHHWFEYYAWSIDPRPSAPLSLIPLVPFDIQHRLIDWLDYITFKKRSSGIAKKARDMGATETVLRWCVHNWLYMDAFIAMLLSDIGTKVDALGNPNTLFEKQRIQLRLLPTWMLPDGFSLENHMGKMLITNPQNNSSFVGIAPTPNSARQYRATFILADEFAFWENGGYEHYTAMSQTSNTICMVSSVNGEFNQYHDLATDHKTPLFEMDWREHPWKNQIWYDSLPFGYLGPAMSEQAIAQEIDQNFKASTPGLVFKNRKEEYLFFTWEELVTFYKQYNQDYHFLSQTGDWKIPSLWSWDRYTDVGQTEGHQWAYLVVARPPKSWALHDTVFVFVAECLKTIGASPTEAYTEMAEMERRVGLRNSKGEKLKRPTHSDMSHEEAAARRQNRKGYIDTFKEAFGEFFSPMQTSYEVGLPKIKLWLDVVDKHKPNPLRPEVEGHPFMGRCRIIFVAPRGEYRCVFDEKKGSFFVTASKSEAGFKMMRAQLAAYHYPPEERGKPLAKMRPVAKFDDLISVLKGCAIRSGPTIVPYTAKESVEAQLPEEYRDTNLTRLRQTPNITEAEYEKYVLQKQVEVDKVRDAMNTAKPKIQVVNKKVLIPRRR